MASVVTVSLENRGKQVASFRLVGNASLKCYIHDVGEPKFGVLNLADVDNVPYQEAFERFLEQAKSVLEKQNS